MTTAKPRHVLLVGTGPMAKDYAKLLREGLHCSFDVVARTQEKAQAFAEEEGGAAGLALAEILNAERYDFAIIATAVESLVDVAERLFEAGHTKVLLEKPGALSPTESTRLQELARRHQATLRIAYNRRYYASVLKLREILEEEAPVAAFFDFTEWASQIAPLPKTELAKNLWAVGNSIHVFDTLAFLLGDYNDLHATVSGQDELDWHPLSATFLGTGRCGEVPVSWCTSWLCPGRWNIEVMTRNGRYKLSPMERLQVLRHNTVTWAEVEVDYSLDTSFKPGLYRMVSEFFAETCAEGDVACHLPSPEKNGLLLDAVYQVVGYPNK